MSGVPIEISPDKKDRADPNRLWTAAFLVLVHYQREGLEPGAEHWQADTRWKRPKLINDIRDKWIKQLDAEHLFPWSDDFVVDVWVSLRKATKPIKVMLCQRLGLSIPDKWRLEGSST
jgi:hypothetical protein